jgi:DnaK suppressor protein
VRLTSVPLASRVAAFRDRLRALRRALVEGGDMQLESISKPGDDGKVDDDAAPLSEMNQVIASNRNRERAARLRQIDDALERLALDPDGFGACETCEEPIPERRLALMPWVTSCIACQELNEVDRRGGPRRSVRDFE